MKNIIRNILVFVIIILIIMLAYQRYQYKKVVNSNLGENNTYIPHEYECTFTKTYRIVNLLSDYVASVPEWSYVVVNKFQDDNVIVLKIPTKLKEKLVEGKYYEFKYTIVGNGSVNTMDDINKYITLDEVILRVYTDDIKVYLTVSETTKEGLEQRQQNICQNVSPILID